jgi:MarR family transcriptional regulator, transcriptional regulator for hemolysin
MDKRPEIIIREPIGRMMGNISRMFLENLHRNLAGLDIKRSYFALLVIEAGEGRLIQQELAEILSCDKVQVVRIIDYLSSHGYVERGQSPDDRRKYNLRITGKAKKQLPGIKKAMKDTTELALNGLEENKITELYALLRSIEKNLTLAAIN